MVATITNGSEQHQDRNSGREDERKSRPSYQSGGAAAQEVHVVMGDDMGIHTPAQRLEETSSAFSDLNDYIHT